MINLSQHTVLLADLNPGETRRINHDNCPAGEDTRRRLYITRPMALPDRVVAYCHNCQNRDMTFRSGHEQYRDQLHKPVPLDEKIITDDVTPPLGMVPDLKDWTTAAQAWAMKNGLTSDLLVRWGIQLDPSTNRVCLPQYDWMNSNGTHQGVYQGHQLRKVEEVYGPKYLTVHSADHTGYTTVFNDTIGTLKGIIVEDYVSAIHIAEALRQMPIKIVVNYGVKVNLEALNALSVCTESTVWLDNDSVHVKEQAEQMKRTLQMIAPNQRVHCQREATDPKHYTGQEIREVLYG